MNEFEFNSSIRQALSFLERARLEELTVNLSRLRVNTSFNEVALNPQSTYEEMYRAALRLSHFNIQLSDFSFFQYSWSDPISWRLAYYPNPWLTGVPFAAGELDELKDLLEAGAIDTEEFFEEIATGFRYHGAVPMLRFEYSEEQYRPVSHPAAHFHIGTSGLDRWAWRRKLSPKSFTMLVVRMFFAERWSENTRFENPNVGNCWELELNASLQNDGVSLEFSNDEAQSVHLAALT